VGDLLQPLLKQNNALLKAILKPNDRTEKTKPKVPSISQTNAADISAGEKQKAFASIKNSDTEFWQGLN